MHIHSFRWGYLDTAPVGLPSGTAHTRCIVYPQSRGDSDTGLWTVQDRERQMNRDRKLPITINTILNSLSSFFRYHEGDCASSPCCNAFPWRAPGCSHTARSLRPDRSSSGSEHTGHSCGRSHSPYKRRLRSACHSDTVRRCRPSGWSQQSHRYSLRGET